jgi:hypothetical protein
MIERIQRAPANSFLTKAEIRTLPWNTRLNVRNAPVAGFYKGGLRLSSCSLASSIVLKTLDNLLSNYPAFRHQRRTPVAHLG